MKYKDIALASLAHQKHLHAAEHGCLTSGIGKALKNFTGGWIKECTDEVKVRRYLYYEYSVRKSCQHLIPEMAQSIGLDLVMVLMVSVQERQMALSGSQRQPLLMQMLVGDQQAAKALYVLVLAGS